MNTLSVTGFDKSWLPDTQQQNTLFISYHMTAVAIHINQQFRQVLKVNIAAFAVACF